MSKYKLLFCMMCEFQDVTILTYTAVGLAMYTQ